MDLEEHKVIDLLPDRSPETLVQWLQNHPGVEMISRDRAGAYADGASRGAPHAIQVADRFHLLSNLREALERLLNRNQAALYEAAKLEPVTLPSEVAREQQELVQPPEADAAEDTAILKGPSSPATKAEAMRERRRAWRHTRYDRAVALHQRGLGIHAIARELQNAPTCGPQARRADTGTPSARSSSRHRSRLRPGASPLKWCVNARQMRSMAG